MAGKAFQDLIPDNLCYGCGPKNPQGLQIKSRWEGQASVCRYQPEVHQTAGPPQFLNGGIIATLIDCHSVCTAIADAYRQEGRKIGTEPHVWFVTAGLNITYLEPTPIEKPVELRARIESREGRKTVVHARLLSGSSECAHGEVVAIRVPAAWRHGLS